MPIDMYVFIYRKKRGNHERTYLVTVCFSGTCAQRPNCPGALFVPQAAVLKLSSASSEAFEMLPQNAIDNICVIPIICIHICIYMYDINNMLNII